MWRFTILFIVLMQAACGSVPEKRSPDNRKEVNNADGDALPEITFLKTEHDFGQISQGEVVGTTFQFTNTGHSNLIIMDASASCGCTVPKWSKEPVPPGGKGTLEVIFDSSGREGIQNKSITVKINTGDEYSILFITADIITK